MNFLTMDGRRTVAITGGASGIGFAAAQRWRDSSSRARVVLLDHDPDTLRSATEALGERVRGVVTDVTDAESVAAAFASIAENEGLDALIACAGNARPADSSELSDDDWNAVMNVHVTGSMWACRAAYPLLRASKGAVVLISSIAGSLGMPRRASYCAAKGAIEALTRSLAVEWARDGIRVNAIAPGYVRTPLTDRLIVQKKLNVAPITARTPLTRFAEPAEIAAPIVWLLGEDASFITGTTLHVDGGITVHGDWYEE